MAEKQKREARIIITRHQRVDLLAELDVYDPQSMKLTGLHIPVGPGEQRVAEGVKKLRDQLIRSGCDPITYKEM